MIATERGYTKPKIGELLRVWDGSLCMVDGHNFIVHDIDSEPTTWPGRQDLCWFVVCNQVKKDGTAGKTLKTFLVSTRGSVVPLEGGL